MSTQLPRLIRLPLHEIRDTYSGYGFVEGVGRTTPDNPRENLLGTPWWTNGKRVVLKLSDEPVALEDIDSLDWSARLAE